MNPFSKKDIKRLFGSYGFLPQKKLGQNFLIDKGVLRKIIKAANLKGKDIVLEIGPGIGNLTSELAKRVKKVITIEKDPRMIEILKEAVKDFKNVKIIQSDILKLNPKTYLPASRLRSRRWQAGNLKPKTYKIVANLPYYIVSPVIRKFLENKNQPKSMVLMVQKEVAQRICAKPPDMTRSTSSGSSRAGRGMSLLAISVQFYAKPEIISFVAKESFWPQPKVDSAIIEITPFAWAHSHFASRRRASAFRMLFFKIVKAGFSQPRKQLINNLTKGLKTNRERIEKWLLKNKIKPQQRAETLSIENWLRLTKTFPSISN